MQIVSAKARPDLVDQLCLKASAGSKRRAQERLFRLDWEGRPETLKWQLAKGNLALPGADYLMLLDDMGLPVCGAGYYRHPTFTVYDTPVTVAMVRMWTAPERRVQWLGTLLLKASLMDIETDLVVLTFNESNRGLHTSLTEARKGLAWPPIWGAFKDLGLRYVNNVWQWCAVAHRDNLIA